MTYYMKQHDGRYRKDVGQHLNLTEVVQNDEWNINNSFC